MNVSVLIATFGAQHWAELAERALASAQGQGACEVLVAHDSEGTASSSRNALAAEARGEWLCFLDADDELGPGYIGAMRRAWEQEQGGPSAYSGDGTPLLLTPAISRVQGAHRQPAQVLPETSLIHANWLVVSTLLPRDLFMEVGGFPEYPIYEDWALMCRLAQAGAQALKVPEAVLYVHPGQRNGAGTARSRRDWHYRIGRDLWPDHYDERMRRRMHLSRRIR